MSQEPEAIDFPDAAPVTAAAALAVVAGWRASGMPLYGLHQIAIALADRVENLEADAANDAGYTQAVERSFDALCEAIGITRGTENWGAWIAGVRARFRVEHGDSGSSVIDGASPPGAPVPGEGA